MRTQTMVRCYIVSAGILSLIGVSFLFLFPMMDVRFPVAFQTTVSYPLHTHLSSARNTTLHDEETLHWLQDWVLRIGSNARKNFVFYNRVPKCGSTTILRLTAAASRQNNIKQVIYYNGIKKWHYPRNPLNELIDKLPKPREALGVRNVSLQLIKRLHNATLHIHHTHYIDFATEAPDIVAPIYVNNLREPMSRFVSGYYYTRQARKQHISWAKTAQMGTSLEECLLQQVPFCANTRRNNGTMNKMVWYFCGASERCRNDQRYAISKALYVMEHEYLIVGHLERLADFLFSLEFLLPEYFRGLTKLMKFREKKGNLRRNQKRGSKPQQLSTAAEHLARTALLPSTLLYSHSTQLFARRFSLLKAISAKVTDRRELYEQLRGGQTLQDLLK